MIQSFEQVCVPVGSESYILTAACQTVVILFHYLNKHPNFRNNKMLKYFRLNKYSKHYLSSLSSNSIEGWQELILSLHFILHPKHFKKRLEHSRYSTKLFK